MLFDRYAKLKKLIPDGTVHAGLKQVMPLLHGKLEKCDPPDVIVEPAGLEELNRAMSFAEEKKQRIAISNGLAPAVVRKLSEQMLILTSRFSGPSGYSESCSSIRVDGGMTLEALAVDLAAVGQRWMPLHPVPENESIGSLIASGWEGFRNWRDGGTMANVREIEWMGYDGRVYLSGSSLTAADTPDLSGPLFGSNGRFGVITALELVTKPMPEARSLRTFELQNAAQALELLHYLRGISPEPEAVVYFNELATSILRSANDGTVSDNARVLVAADWDVDCTLEPIWEGRANLETDPKEVNLTWQDFFRMPRAAARLSPFRTTARLGLPASAVEDMEERARDLSKDYNLGIAIWGTPERGHMHLWILQPDGEVRTNRQAGDLLLKLAEDAARLGGCLIDAEPSSLLQGKETPPDEVSELIIQRLTKQCDPMGIYCPLRTD